MKRGTGTITCMGQFSEVNVIIRLWFCVCVTCRVGPVFLGI